MDRKSQRAMIFDPHECSTTPEKPAQGRMLEAAMAEQGVDPMDPPFLHLLSAFLAMEPTNCLVSLARACGEGLITEAVQRFIWDNCISKVEQNHVSYSKNFLKKLINEIESVHGDVMDELYEQYASYMILLKDVRLVKENSRVLKCISFLFPPGGFEVPTCPKSMQLAIPLHCSLNMLEGDTGCSIWPSSLFLSEFILSYPEIFSSKSCFEVGSGVGLVGICLAHVKASKVILSEGDPSSLANMKLNLELNQLHNRMDELGTTNQDPNLVKCIFLPWESAEETELQNFMPDVILGADVIYNPLCIPYLIRVLAILLDRTRSSTPQQDNCVESPESRFLVDIHNDDHGRSDANANDGKNSVPTAYIASVIRNQETFSYFLELAEEANLEVKDMTELCKPFDLLPYMQSYDRSSVRLFTLSYSGK